VRRLLLVVLALVALAGCGDGDSGDGGAKPTLKVFAASSLKEAFTAYGGAKFSFAGSDELAAQIREGIAPDVFASANTKYPDQLFRAGLVEKPVDFTTNRLVLASPADGDVRSPADAGGAGVKVAVGAKGVPVGDYTRDVLGGLGPEGAAILRNVRSEEPDVKGIVAKLTQSAADAGFVYITDVNATKGTLRAIELPASAQPRVVYAAAVVKGTKHPDEAKAFIDGLLSGRGAQALRAAGFEPPPA
jgi:molybdate transport system substrate-binding protein